MKRQRRKHEEYGFERTLEYAYITGEMKKSLRVRIFLHETKRFLRLSPKKKASSLASTLKKTSARISKGLKELPSEIHKTFVSIQSGAKFFSLAYNLAKTDPYNPDIYAYYALDYNIDAFYNPEFFPSLEAKKELVSSAFEIARNLNRPTDSRELDSYPLYDKLISLVMFALDKNPFASTESFLAALDDDLEERGPIRSRRSF